MIIVFDLDGTLCDTPEGTDYDDVADLLAKCRPRAAVLERVRELARLGHDLAVVTARGPHVAAATKQQLHQWLAGVELVVRHRPRLDFGWQHYVSDKEAQYRQLGAHITVGDRAEDKAAGLRAGCRFVWDWEFETHGIVTMRPSAAEATA